ncbi:hypothetical protein Tco_0375087 [Tanacetum coccineum]
MQDTRTMSTCQEPRGLRGRNLIPEIVETIFELKMGYQSCPEQTVLRTNSSTQAVSSDVAELKDIVRALLLDKKNQASAPAPAPAPVKAVELSCVTCGGAHSHQNCPATHGNVYRDNISEYVSQAAAANLQPRSGTLPVVKPNRGDKGPIDPSCSQSTAPVQPPVGPEPITTPVFEPIIAPVVAPVPNTKPSVSLPYPSRRDNEKSLWEKLSLPDLTPTCMTLELADRSISKPLGNCKRTSSVKVDASLKTGRALIDVHKGELTLRIGSEAITYNLDQTSRYSANYTHMTANKIDVIDMACEEYSQEVLGFTDTIASGNPLQADSFLGLADDPDCPAYNPFYYDPEGDILILEAILNSEPPLPPPSQGTNPTYLPEVRTELKVCETNTANSSVYETY